MKKKATLLLKSLFMAYIITMLLLLVLAYALYQVDLSEKIVQMGIIGTYFISNFMGGQIAGKLAKTKRFVWGGLSGIFYFLIMFLMSLLIYHSPIWGEEMLLATSICVGSSMIGAMIS